MSLGGLVRQHIGREVALLAVGADHLQQWVGECRVPAAEGGVSLVVEGTVGDAQTTQHGPDILVGPGQDGADAEDARPVGVSPLH